MKRILPWSTIRGRMLLLAIGVELVMLSFLVYNSIRHLQGTMADQVRWQAAQIAPVLNAALTAPLAQQDFATVQAVLDEARVTEGIDYAAVSRSGHCVAASGWPIEQPLPQPSRYLFHKYTYDVVTPISHKGQELGGLHFGLNVTKIITARRSLALQSLGIAALEVLLSFVILTLIGYWITRHLTALTQASLQVAAGDLNLQPVWEGKDDIGRLGVAFNTMSRAIAGRVRELTQAKETAEEMAAERDSQKALLKSTIDSTTDLVFYKDPDGRYLGCNLAFAQYAGRPMEEIAGLTDYDLFPGDIAERLRQRDCQVLERGESRSDEMWVQSPDGHRVLLETKRSPLRHTDGHPIGLIAVSRDVTERKKTEEALRESEGRLQNIMESVQAGIMIIDPETHTIVDANQNALQMIGAPRGEVLGRICHTFICPADEGKCPVTDLGQEVDNSERVLLRADGTRMAILKTVVAITLGGKRHLLETFIDITQRKRAEEELLRNRNQLSATIEAIPDILFDVDAGGEILNVHATDETLLSMPKNKIAGMNLKDLLPPDAFEIAAEAMIAAGRNGTDYGRTMKLVVENKERWFEISVARKNLSDKEGSQFIALVRDITRRQKAEETLRQSEEQVKLLLNSTAEAIYGMDLQGCCTFVNLSCLRMLGYTEPAELLGKNMHDTIHHSFPGGAPMPVEKCRIYKAFREGRRVHVADEVLWRADGTSFPVEYWSYPQIISGQVIGAVVTFTDITERKHEEEVREMEQRIRLARDLHDGMLQSLTAAALQMQVVHQQMETDPQGARMRLLEIQKYVTSTQRDMRRQIQELKRPLPPDGVPPLQERLRDLAERTRSNWHLKVEMEARLSGAPLVPVMEQQIYFLIQEAITNAAKHAAASIVRVDLARDEQGVRIHIEDNGRGFPFEGRYDLGTLARMGIGPASLRERIGSLGGKLLLESSPAGARLEITLPLEHKEI